MIYLITGTPGAGKTLFTVKMLLENLVHDGREIYTNIEGLNVDQEHVHHIENDEVKDWPNLPDKRIYIIDECQQHFPNRNQSSRVPLHVSKFETHRHHGHDFYLITQGPTLLDPHIRPLVTEHIHLYRAYGLSRASVFRWNTINMTPNPVQSRITAERENFSYPKKYFQNYKSSVQHTAKSRIPKKLLAIAALLIAGAVFAVYNFFQIEMIHGKSQVEVLADNLDTIPKNCFKITGRVGVAYLVDLNGLVRRMDAKKLERDGTLYKRGDTVYTCL